MIGIVVEVAPATIGHIVIKTGGAVLIIPRITHAVAENQVPIPHPVAENQVPFPADQPIVVSILPAHLLALIK